MNSALTQHEILDTKLRAAGMLTVAEMLNGGPLDGFIKHASVVDAPSLLRWVEMRRAEFLRQIALYEIGERDTGDELYEWILAHCSAFTELHINMKAGLSGIADLTDRVNQTKLDLEKISADLTRLIATHTLIAQNTIRLIDIFAGHARSHGCAAMSKISPSQPRAAAMSKVTIDRELLEHMRNFTVMHDSGVAGVLRGQIDAILAQPAQQSEAVEVVAWRMWNGKTWRFCYSSDHAKNGWEPLMTVAQHQRILAASVPAGCKVVPVDLIERTICRLTHGHEHDKVVRELRAILEAKDE